MLLAHAIAIAEARSYIAALANTATTVLGSVAYDRVRGRVASLLVGAGAQGIALGGDRRPVRRLR